MRVAHRPVEGAHPSPSGWDASALTRWSWAMVLTALIVWLLTSVLSQALKGPLGLHEGDVLLMARTAGAWFAEVGFVLIDLAAPVVGVGFGAVALRRGGRALSLVAVVVNAALCLVIVYMFVDDVHMTYFPRWWW